MNSEPKEAYINQPIPVPICGKAFRVVFEDGSTTPLLTKLDAEYVLTQTKKYKALSLKSSIRKALKDTKQ